MTPMKRWIQLIKEWQTRPLTIIGYVMVSLMEYLIFAPVFLYRFVRNWNRQKEVVETEDEASEDSSLL